MYKKFFLSMFDTKKQLYRLKRYRKAGNLQCEKVLNVYFFAVENHYSFLQKRLQIITFSCK